MAKRVKKNEITQARKAGQPKGYTERLPGVFVLDEWVEEPRLMRIGGEWCGVGGGYSVPGKGGYLGKEWKEATREQYRSFAERSNLVIIIEPEKNEEVNDVVSTTEPDTGGD